jgi:hypothetical protein
MTAVEDHPTVKRIRAQQHKRPASPQPTLDAEWLRIVATEAGADDIGFVEISHPDVADQREEILSNFPRAKTLISFVVRMNRENIRTPARSISNLEFHHAGDEANEVARRITADSRTWLQFVGREVSIVWALVRRKIRIAGGSPKLLMAFGRCFPS